MRLYYKDQLVNNVQGNNIYFYFENHMKPKKENWPLPIYIQDNTNNISDNIE